jgi:hypothetical protein
MSRGYSRSGGGLTIILAIIGTLIVVVVGIFLYNKFSNGGMPFGSKATPSPTPMLTTPEPTATAVPSPTLVAIVTPEPTVEPSASVDILGGDSSPTVAPVTAAPNFQTVTVAVAKLSVRSGAGSSYSKVGSVTYNQTYEVFAESSKWVQIRVNNTYGWIYTGVDSSGCDCAVRGSEAVPAMPTAAPKPSYLKSVTLNGDTLTVTFTTNVWGNKDKTENLGASDFTVKEGSGTIQCTVTHTAGTSTATLKLGGSTNGGKITVSIASGTVFNSSGEESPAGSVSTSTSSTDQSRPVASIVYSGNSFTVSFTDNDASLTIDPTKVHIRNTGVTGTQEASFVGSPAAGTNCVTGQITFGAGSGYDFWIDVDAGCATDAALNGSISASANFHN